MIAKEAMVEEEGKFYTVMETFWNNGSEGEPGGTDKKQSWYVYGKSLIENKDRVLASYLTCLLYTSRCV